MSTAPVISEGDFVVVSGGGIKRILQVKKGCRTRLGNSGSVDIHSLVGLRYGSVARLLPKGMQFIPTNDYPDLDITALGDGDIDVAKDNRELIDDNQSQKLSNSEVAAIRQEGGVDALLGRLVENSTTFHSKTTFAQEKYLKKKQKKYGTLFKIDRVTVDQIAEIHVPTILPSDTMGEQEHNNSSSSLRLRVDTVGLILHHSEVHANSRVLMFERTNGFLPCCFLTRLGDKGRIYHVLEKNAQPNTFHAKMLQLKNVKAKWKAIPKNECFLLGVEASQINSSVDHGQLNEPKPSSTTKSVASTEGIQVKSQELEPKEEEDGDSSVFVTKRARKEGTEEERKVSLTGKDTERNSDTAVIQNCNQNPMSDRKNSSDNIGDQRQSQWIKGIDAYNLLRQEPCDSLVIADDKTALTVLQQLFPFLAYGGNLIIYSPYLEDMSALFAWVRRECVMIRVSETWCRHMQVLPQRTHPTVNMSTAGGYLLTAIKINPANRSGLSWLPPEHSPPSISV